MHPCMYKTKICYIDYLQMLDANLVWLWTERYRSCDWPVARPCEISHNVHAGGGHFEHMLLNYCSFVHRVSKNVPPLTCYNLDIHSSITIIFGTRVTEKVGNQNVLYFPTSSNLCVCTTWGNRKPKIASFDLNSAYFIPKIHKTH